MSDSVSPAYKCALCATGNRPFHHVASSGRDVECLDWPREGLPEARKECDSHAETKPRSDTTPPLADAEAAGAERRPFRFYREKHPAPSTEAQAVERVIQAAKALKFSAYPAHGSGWVIAVTGGNVNDLQDALAALAPQEKE